MREKTVEDHFTEEVARRGGWVVKGENVAGFPDRIVFGPDGHVGLVELKAPSGRVSKIQKGIHRRLQRLGHPVEVIWTREGVDSFLEDFFGD